MFGKYINRKIKFKGLQLQHETTHDLQKHGTWNNSTKFHLSREFLLLIRNISTNKEKGNGMEEHREHFLFYPDGKSFIGLNIFHLLLSL